MKRAKRTKRETPEVCPVCGEDVPRGSLACPECGADHNSGWREDAETYDAVDLPDADFDYDDFKEREFGLRVKPSGMKSVWWITSIMVLAFLIVLFVLTR